MYEIGLQISNKDINGVPLINDELLITIASYCSVKLRLARIGKN